MSHNHTNYLVSTRDLPVSHNTTAATKFIPEHYPRTCMNLENFFSHINILKLESNSRLPHLAPTVQTHRGRRSVIASVMYHNTRYRQCGGCHMETVVQKSVLTTCLLLFLTTNFSYMLYVILFHTT